MVTASPAGEDHGAGVTTRSIRILCYLTPEVLQNHCLKLGALGSEAGRKHLLKLGRGTVRLLYGLSGFWGEYREGSGLFIWENFISGFVRIHPWVWEFLVET